MKQYLIKMKDGKKGLYGEINKIPPRCFSNDNGKHCIYCNDYRSYLSSLPFVAFAEALPNKEGDIVGENEFKVREYCEACNGLGGGIRHCAHPEECGQTVKVAIPISNEKEETKGEDEKEQAANDYLKRVGTHDRPDITKHDFIQGWEAKTKSVDAGKEVFSRKDMENIINMVCDQFGERFAGRDEFINRTITEYLNHHISQSLKQQ